MTLIVEDGTGKADANSYVSLDEANAYWSDRAGSASDHWFSLSPIQREAALIEAAEWLDLMFTYFGLVTSANQAMQWPRKDVNGVDDDQIPTAIKIAQRRLAIEAPLFPSSVQSTVPQISKEEYGDIKVEYETSETTVDRLWLYEMLSPLGRSLRATARAVTR